MSEPFSQWGDTNSYELVAQGDFEGSLSQWTLGGGASAVPGSEPYGATGTVGSYSLALPGGQLGAVAVHLRNGQRSDLPLLRAQQQPAVDDRGRRWSTRRCSAPWRCPLGVVALSGTWQPTAPMLTASVVAGLLSGGTAELALRFTEVTGSSQIDDIFIDPRMR